MITTKRAATVWPGGQEEEGAKPAPDDAMIACLSGGERQLWEAAERAFRQPHGKLIIVLHLSKLPAPRAYHVRVARVLLEDTACRHAGQVFAMRNHDLILLCTRAPQDAGNREHAPDRLPDVLGRLFAADAPKDVELTSLWELERDGALLMGDIRARAGVGVCADEDEAVRGQPVSLAALQEIIAKAPLLALLTQQTGLSLSAHRARPLAARLAPAFQAVGIGLEGLRLGPLLHHALSDPFLYRHFADVLDLRLIGLLKDDLAGRCRLLRGAQVQAIPVMVELGLRAIVSPGFAECAHLAAAAGVRLWVAVSLLQAGSEIELLDHARGLLRMTGCSLVLNRFDPGALGLVRPALLKPDLIALAWSQQLLHAAGTSTGFAEVLRMGVTRCILQGVDGEQALAWGQANGVGLFAGNFLDQVQAATRMERCHSAGACTLRACVGRAAALSQMGRAGCANPALLASGFCTGA